MGQPPETQDERRSISRAGVYGVGEVIPFADRGQPMGTERSGWVVDRGRMLKQGTELPARVATLDELLLIVRHDTPFRFDPALGNSFYGADLCLQAREPGLATVALGALSHHRSRHIGLIERFHESAAGFARKWRHRLPIATSCVIVDCGDGVHLLANSDTTLRRSLSTPG